LIAFLLHKLPTYQLTRALNSRFQERLAERTRIAQELHDTLLQSFQGLMLRFQTGINYLPSNPDHAKNTLEAALDKADLALAESRNAIQNIRGQAAADFDLIETMNSIMQAMKAEADFKEENAPRFQLLLEGTPRPVNPVLQDDIYRIAVESLRNSFQHARAKQIETEITYGGRLLRIRFRDDGVGIHPNVLAEGHRTGHWGLVGMQERAERIGAKLDIWSRAGAGTEIELRLPGQIAYETPTTKSRRRASGRKAGIHGN
jgi:signal transduction histidine kinase